MASAQWDWGTAISKSGDNALQLTYRQLETTLAAYLEVHPDDMPRFRSRIKQLQRLEFPAGVNIGRGVRMSYTAVHLLQLAVAFELIGTGLPAKTATDLVINYWERFESAFGRAFSRQKSPDWDPTYVCIPGQPPIPATKSPRVWVTVHDQKSLTTEVLHKPKTLGKGRAAMQILQVGYLFERINQLAVDVGHVQFATSSAEYGRWRDAREAWLKTDGFDRGWDYADGMWELPFLED